MMLPSLSEIGRDIQVWSSKHSPEILTGIGVTGMFAAIALAVMNTPKALDCIEEEKELLEKEDLTAAETIKATWKCYIPSAVTAGLSTACLIGSVKVGNRRAAALATAYGLSEQALKTYKEKVIETIGENKEKKIRDEIAKDTINHDPVVNKEVIITGSGETLCYDPISCRYFKADMEKIRRLEAELNKQLYSEMFVSLNDFYYGIGLRSSELGDELGWNVDDGTIEFDYSSQLCENGLPCLVVGFHISPRYDYRNLR